MKRIYEEEGGYSIPVGGLRIQDKARTFLSKHGALFGIDPEGVNLERDLVITSGQLAKGRSAVRLDQYVDEIRVVGNGYRILFNEEDEIIFVTGRLNPDVSVSTSASVPISTALSLAVGAATEGVEDGFYLDGLLGALVPENRGLVIIDDVDDPYLAHAIRVYDEETGFNVSVLIDAQTGATRSVTNLNLTVDGSMGVRLSRAPFVSNPTYGSSDPTYGVVDPTYGVVYATNPADGGPITVQLPFLTGSLYLDGAFASVSNFDGTRASEGPDYFYPPSSDRFDEVNVYYHLSDFGDHLEDISGYNYPAQDAKVLSSFHTNNAQYRPTSNLWIFGDAEHGAGLTSRDADIIRHEFAHYAFRVQGFEATEPGKGAAKTYTRDQAVHEAQADYLAASYENDPIIGEWFAQCSNTGDLRRLNTDPSVYNRNNIISLETTTYSDCQYTTHNIKTYNDQFHHLGMIWSGALWDVRSEIGQATTDETVMQMTNAFLGDIPNFTAVADAFKIWTSLEDRCQVKDAFHARGLSAACDLTVDPDPDYAANIYGKDFVTSKKNETFTTTTVGGTGTSTYDWYYRVLGTSTWSYVKSGPSYTRFIYIGHPSFQLKVDATSGASTASAIHTAYYYDSSGPGGGAIAGTAEIPGPRRDAAQPLPFGLGVSFPNPVRDRATVEVSVPDVADVELAVYDLLGRRVLTVAQGTYAAGTHSVGVDVSALSPGTYLYRLTVGGDTDSKRLTIIR